MKNAKILEKMIRFYEGSLHDTDHFMKVYAYASSLGKLENLGDKTQSILEKASIVHDISCPLCRQKYGNAAGHYQEAESEALLRPFLAEFCLDDDELERIIYIVSRHHTLDGVEGMDHQILIEADYIVNAGEQHLNADTVRAFRDSFFKTESGKRILTDLFLL